MKAWKQKKSFLTLLKADPEVIATLPLNELDPLFDEQYYLRYMDEIFERAGLTEVQWKRKGKIAESTGLAPRTI
jgi:hypothetical protein